MTEQEELAILTRSLVQVVEALTSLGAEAELAVTLSRVERAARPARNAGLLNELVTMWQAEFAQQPGDEEARAVIALTLGAMRGELPDWAEQDPSLN